MSVAGVPRAAQEQAQQTMVRTIPAPDVRPPSTDTVTVADVVRQARTHTLPVSQ
jgi:hypothetical protein